MQLNVAGWTYPRHAYVADNHLFFEVARINCSHCATCSRRMSAAESSLSHAGVASSWHRKGGGYYLSVPYDQEREPAEFLSDLLGLTIT